MFVVTTMQCGTVTSSGSISYNIHLFWWRHLVNACEVKAHLIGCWQYLCAVCFWQPITLCAKPGCCCCPAWQSVSCHCCPAWQTVICCIISCVRLSGLSQPIKRRLLLLTYSFNSHALSFVVSFWRQWLLLQVQENLVNLKVARWCNGQEDVGLVTRGRRFESRPWHCLVISEIADRISPVNYLGI